jgi:hypothetical protein
MTVRRAFNSMEAEFSEPISHFTVVAIIVRAKGISVIKLTPE